jgi:hypothetical protein
MFITALEFALLPHDVENGLKTLLLEVFNKWAVDTGIAAASLVSAK